MQARALLALPILFTACSKPDLSPIREGLTNSAAVLCAPPPARPAHAPKVRDVSADETTAALLALCEADLAHALAPPGPVDVLHEALLADRANVGLLRRTIIQAEPGVPVKCDATFATVDKVLLRGAVTTKDANEALDRCADVVAIARDQDLAGATSDVLFANTLVQSAVEACLPIVEHAPGDAAGRFHKALVVLRSTFPTTFDDADARADAEDVLLGYGQVYPQDTPLACPGATQLATHRKDHDDPAGLLRSWRSRKPERARAEYREAYALTLGALDRLVSLAEVVSQSSTPKPASRSADAQAP